jgi:hypothetical protein
MFDCVSELWKILRCAQGNQAARTFAGVSPLVPAFCRFMRTYLRVFNPLIALLVFVLCSFAAMKEDKDKPIVIGNVVAGGIPTYFFAKGMFCGVALILLGKILENQLGGGADR